MVFCSECGTRSEDGKKFCFSCGAKLFVPASATTTSSTTTSSVTRSNQNNNSNHVDDASLFSWAQYQAAKCGYNVENWTTSWQDGLAFCALIHLHRDDLVPRIDSMDINDRRNNVALAIDTAEQLGLGNTVTVNDILSPTGNDALQKSVIAFVRKLYGFSLQPHTSLAKAMDNDTEPVTPSNQKPFTNLDEAVQYLQKNGGMELPTGLLSQCAKCQRLGVTVKMLKVGENVYCDGPCGRQAFVEKYRKK